MVRENTNTHHIENISPSRRFVIYTRYKDTTRRNEIKLLMQGISNLPQVTCTSNLPPPNTLPSTATTVVESLLYTVPLTEDTRGQANVRYVDAPFNSRLYSVLKCHTSLILRCHRTTSQGHQCLMIPPYKQGHLLQ